MLLFSSRRFRLYFPVSEAFPDCNRTTEFFVADVEWVPMYLPLFQRRDKVRDKRFRRRWLIGDFGPG